MGQPLSNTGCPTFISGHLLHQLLLVPASVCLYILREFLQRNTGEGRPISPLWPEEGVALYEVHYSCHAAAPAQRQLRQQRLHSQPCPHGLCHSGEAEGQ